MIAILDYGVGNLFSLNSSLKALGYFAENVTSPTGLKDASHIILPGVGAFGDAAKCLSEAGLRDELISQAKAGKPILGICLGMQLLLSKSYEFGCHEGLGLIDGEVRPIAETIPKNLKIPHIGWNELSFNHNHPLFRDIRQGDCVYFVHSYHAVNCPDVIATTDYGATLTAAVGKDNIMGCQFHPEKSGEVGLKILNSFCKM